MAGSFDALPTCSDSSLQARLDGLKLLAQCLEEPIVIFNPQMEMVYANPSAEHIRKACPLMTSVDPESRSGDPAGIPCDPCPGKALFSEQGSVGMATGVVDGARIGSNAACPLPRALPLGQENGTVQFAVMMGAHGRQSQIIPTRDFTGALRDSVEKIVPDVTHPEIPLIGDSQAMQQLVEMIKLVAASEATVLIQGESGTGKELVAKTIHGLSRRRLRPFVVVECSALPDTLLESELFGHVRGAFTGAVADRKGLFEEAEGGTIFLDEIADTSPAFQARLLRVLQEGEIRPVGSNRSIKVNVRVISAGNKPIEELVASKLFRADLYYRLAVLPLTVPPLRDRQEDIPLLVSHFLTKSALRHGRTSPNITAETYKALVQQPWQGNVRELENLIERVVVTCSGPTIQVQDVFGQANQSIEPAKRHLKVIGNAARQEAERQRIVEALREVKGDKTRAARILKISRSSLYNKLRSYHIT